MKDTKILLDMTTPLYFVQDQLNLLLLEDISTPLILELTIDCWNIKNLLDAGDDEIFLIIKNKIDRYIDGSSLQKLELIVSIKKCVESILKSITELLIYAIPENTSYLQFSSIDDYKEVTILARSETFDDE